MRGASGRIVQTGGLLDEVLLREVQILLVLRIDVHLWVLAAENFTIFSIVGCVIADFQWHLVELPQTLGSLL